MRVDNTSAIQEAMRRRAGQQPSSAGIGATVANSPSAQNPLASSSRQPAPTGGPITSNPKQSNPFTAMAIAGVKQLGETSPDDIEVLLKAIIQRLRTSGGPTPQNV